VEDRSRRSSVTQASRPSGQHHLRIQHPVAGGHRKLRLPAQANRATRCAAHRLPPLVIISHTVLIDDADVVRRTANRMLTKDGYRVLEAAALTSAWDDSSHVRLR
jgi:hypothetical protein